MQLQLSLAAIIRIIFALLLSAIAVLAQGPLSPPAPPSPTMKSLQQIEPRIDLQSNPPPAGVNTNDPNYAFIITAPGSYYLSANLGVTKPSGIQINAEGVTLHLEGFEISRLSGSGGDGIEIVPTAHRTAISHGSIKGFAYGIHSLEGMTGGFARGAALDHLAVSGCTAVGIAAGGGTTLESCRAHENTEGIKSSGGSTFINCTATKNNGAGITAESGSSLLNCASFQNGGVGILLSGGGSSMRGCVATGNLGTAGILANQNSSLTDCVGSSNSSTAPISAGITAGSGSVLVNCTADANSSTAAPTPTTGMGFNLGVGSLIRGCVASGNKGDGIRAADNGAVRDNQCDGNGSGAGTGAGIYAAGSDIRIEGNNVTDNDRGIETPLSGNLIIKNSASGNTGPGPLPAPNYVVGAGNFLGTIVATEAAMNASTNSNINLSF